MKQAADYIKILRKKYNIKVIDTLKGEYNIKHDDVFKVINIKSNRAIEKDNQLYLQIIT